MRFDDAMVRPSLLLLSTLTLILETGSAQVIGHLPGFERVDRVETRTLAKIAVGKGCGNAATPALGNQRSAEPRFVGMRFVCDWSFFNTSSARMQSWRMRWNVRTLTIIPSIRSKSCCPETSIPHSKCPLNPFVDT